MPTNRNLRSVAAALLAMAMTVTLLAACPRQDHDPSTAAPAFDTAVAMATGTAPPDPHEERRMAMRASRDRVEAARVAAEAEAKRILEEAQARALEQQRKARELIERQTPAPPAVMDASFWRRLANCENADGDGDGNGGGYFQFSPDTARKVGYRPGMSYEQQRALAEKWLAMIGGPRNGGGRSGWPHCWWVALRA